MSIDAKTLLVLIHEQFSRIPYPGDDHIVLDNTREHIECEEIRRTLVGHHWCEVSFEQLDQLHSALFFLSPEGYRFYLPAFMFYSVADFERADVIPDEVIQTLTFPSKLDISRIEEFSARMKNNNIIMDDEWNELVQMLGNSYKDGSLERLFLDRISGFDIGQRQVIRKFLEYIGDVYRDEYPNQEPQIAINRFWYQFDQKGEKSHIEPGVP